MGPPRFVFSEYIREAMYQASYDKLEDDTWVGRVPLCKGVVAFGKTLAQCQEELRSVLEDWIFVGLKLGHKLPVMAGIDLNEKPRREPVESV